MSDPVGNAPRVPDIPGNTHRQREQAAEKVVAEEKEPAQKMIEGKVTTVKAPWYKRATRNMLAEDFGTVRGYVLSNVMVPAIRNLVRDIVVGGVDQALYGQSHARGARGGVLGERPGLRTRYDLMGSEPEPRKMLSRDARARHDFDEVVLADREEAISIVEALIGRLERYRAVSVADLYDFVGVTGSYADRNWGWTDLRTADVRQFRGGWLLDLPQPEPLR